MRIPSHIVQKADQCHLGIHCAEDGIMAGIFDIKTKQPLWLEYQHLQQWEWMQAIQDWKWNQPLFRKISVTHCSQQWTLCPQHLLMSSNFHIGSSPMINGKHDISWWQV